MFCWIGLPIHFEKWIWIGNHKFAKDLDWIGNPKKIGFSNTLLIGMVETELEINSYLNKSFALNALVDEGGV